MWATPAVTVFIASLVDAPIIGMKFAAANRSPRSEALSLEAARVPLNAINASKKEKEKTSIEIRFFFNVLTIPMTAHDGATDSVMYNENRIIQRGKRYLANISVNTDSINVTDEYAAVAEKGAPPSKLTE